jgi:RimJ/RimL family protein N-acetyltransferase
MDPLLLDIPALFESERLIIRVPRAGDGAVLNAAVRDSWADLKPWMPWAQQVPSVIESEAYVRRKNAAFAGRTDVALLLFCKQDGALVGASGLHRLDWVANSAEIGYWMHSAYQGQGYMTEAVQAITAFAFAELHAERVTILCDDRNLRSARVAERSGFTLEGVHRKERRDVEGKLFDMRVYARLR